MFLDNKRKRITEEIILETIAYIEILKARTLDK